MPNTKKTRELIITEAIRLFSQYGSDAVSIREIAAAAGIQGGSLYNHFASKAELMDCVIERFEQVLKRYPYPRSDIPALLQTETTVDILRRFAFDYPRDRLAEILSLYRILFAEQHTNPRLRLVLTETLIREPQRIIAQAIDCLAALGKIPPCDSSLVAGVWVRTFLVMGIEATHRLGTDEQDHNAYYHKLGDALISMVLGRPLLPEERRTPG